MKFAYPGWLLLGAVALALALGYVLVQRRRRRHTCGSPIVDLLDKVAPKRPGRSGTCRRSSC